MSHQLFFIRAPVQGSARITVCGRIHSLNCFSCSRIFVECEILLYDGCSLSKSESLSKVTSPVFSSQSNNDTAIHCSFPFNFDLELSPNTVASLLDPSHTPQLFSQPILTFCVRSVDFWGRQWVVGYSWAPITIHTPFQSLNLPCFALSPCQFNLIHRLTELFLGSSTSFSSPTEAVTPSYTPDGFNSSIFTYFGVNSKSSGTISLDFTTCCHFSKSCYASFSKLLDQQKVVPPQCFAPYAKKQELERVRFSSDASKQSSQLIPPSETSSTTNAAMSTTSTPSTIPPKAIETLERLRRRHRSRARGEGGTL
ncbi:hypothetical protein P9112_002288 [Eukaryota sp. TZLM1-RC]